MLATIRQQSTRYTAIVSRDPSHDGAWWFGVTTTHVFCRPSCPCRLPLEENVEYFTTPGAAMKAGYRPCLRCRPLGGSDDHTLIEGEVSTPLGPMIGIGSSHGLALLEFADRPMLGTQRERVARLFRQRPALADLPGRDELQAELDAYFAGRLRVFTVPILPLGTPFQRAVWQQLSRVRYGATATYESLGRALGRVGAGRAVGRANGDNRFAILVPCHRVVGSDGNLTGYGGGLWRKRALLDLEGALPQVPAAGQAVPPPARRLRAGTRPGAGQRPR